MFVLDNPDIFITRFGTISYYEDWFHGHTYYDPRVAFKSLECTKKKSPEDYENTRQELLKLLGQQRNGAWQPTSRVHDVNVEILCLHRCELTEDYLAFMRIRPKGFRGDRLVPKDMKISFHLLFGSVNFFIRKKPKVMHKGAYISVPPKAVFSIRSLGDEVAYFLFRIHRHEPAVVEKTLAIEGPRATPNRTSNRRFSSQQV